MPSEASPEQRPNASSAVSRDQYVDEESLVCRNFDSERTHEVTIRFLNPDDEIVFRETYTIAPQSVVSVGLRLGRAVYCVVVRVDTDRGATAECLIGSGPHETALVEIGNGLVSVTEGLS